MTIDLTNVEQFLAIGLPLIGILIGVWKTAFNVGDLVREQKNQGAKIKDHGNRLDTHERRLNNHAQRLSKHDGLMDEE